MILNSLHTLYDRLAEDPDYEIAKAGYAPQLITFRIILKPTGDLFDIVDARLPDSKGKLRAVQRICLGFEGSRSRDIKPYFLCDKSLYMLGYETKEKDLKKLGEKFSAFREKLLTAELQINCDEFKAVCNFLRDWSPERAAEFFSDENRDEFLANGFGYFEIQGSARSVDQQPQVVAWWEAHAAKSSAPLGICLITGEYLPVVRNHPKIKGVTGGQAEQSLISFNDTAFRSYGKDKEDKDHNFSTNDRSFNAPVSEKAAFEYGTALNSLLNGPRSFKHRIRIGDTTCVFWTEKPSIVEDVFGLFASNGDNAPEKAQDESIRSKVENFLKALRIGGEAEANLTEDPDQTEFYLLGLAPNAARLSVRFFHRSTVTDLLANLRAHHRDIGIVRTFETAKGKRPPDPEFPAYWQLLREIRILHRSEEDGKISWKEGKEGSDKFISHLTGSLMRSILENSPYPDAFLSSVVRRIRAEKEINYLRAAIIKGILTRNHKQTITIMLDKENQNPAYLLGRLFAALEKTQQDALGDLNAGLRDKFYSSASATPASVFPRILRTYQHHLEKMLSGKLAERIGSEKARRAKTAREILVQDILSGISAEGFPHNFNLKSQGVFALGYYHQRKDFFTKKSED